MKKFTLIELLVLIAIIGILASLLITLNDLQEPERFLSKNVTSQHLKSQFKQMYYLRIAM